MPVKTTQSGVKETSSKRIRRAGALARLKAQLQFGTKSNSNQVEPVEITENDIKRIKAEIKVLESRV